MEMGSFWFGLSINGVRRVGGMLLRDRGVEGWKGGRVEGKRREWEWESKGGSGVAEKGYMYISIPRSKNWQKKQGAVGEQHLVSV